MKTTRKKGNIPDCLSNTTPKSPLKTSRTKIESRNAIKPPAMPKSRLRVSSSVSPQSSVDSWTSESSLSASTLIKHSHSFGSPDADSSSSSSSPSFKVTFDIDAIQPQELRKPPIDKPYITKEITGTIPQSQITTEEPTRTQVSVKSFIGDNSTRNIRRSSEVNNAKPSGLRLPTPKIGYFDPGQSLLQNPSRYSLNATRKYLPKNTSLDSNTIGARKLDSGMCDPTGKDSKPSNQTNHEDACLKDSILFKEASMENDLHSSLRSSGKENFSSQDQDAVKVKSEFLEQKLSSFSLLDEKDLNINLEVLSSST
ncbi:hypothetical protein IHE45_12G074000 [Dioscorea alata]|uniref:Uncharacterized protein n=1 Tax=Dioscorea alata TaxID=55571 RepID=A0ACB7V3J7_DIOAL|nr:hypothetical protein IHE45_12G074000 [Dioscorea alata]